VAEANPASIDPNGQMLRREAGGIAYDTNQEETDSYWGLLAPGETVSGTYLWRDVNGCWREDGAITSLSAGTYTLLAMQSISLQQYDTGVSIGSVGVPEPALLDGDVRNDPAVSTVTTVSPVQEDWLELQAWTSLGTVTITTR